MNCLGGAVACNICVYFSNGTFLVVVFSVIGGSVGDCGVIIVCELSCGGST